MYDLHSHTNQSEHHDKPEEHEDLGDQNEQHKGHGNQVDAHELHEKSVWLGFVVMVSLMVFFSFERIINKLGEWRERRKREKNARKKIPMAPQMSSVDKKGDGKYVTKEDTTMNKEDKDKQEDGQEFVIPGGSNPEAMKVKVIRSGHRPTCDMVVGERVCKHRYSSICVDDIDEIMNEGVNNCPNQQEACPLRIKANNNDNNPCGGEGLKATSSCTKKDLLAIEKVPDQQIESQKKDIVKKTEIITVEIPEASENLLQDENNFFQNATIHENGNGENISKGVHLPEVKFAEKLLKAKRIFMNSSPTKAETPSEAPLGKMLFISAVGMYKWRGFGLGGFFCFGPLDKITVFGICRFLCLIVFIVTNMKVDTDDQEIDMNCSGVMSTATSQTPFLLPTSSDSCLIAPNGQTKLEKQNLQVTNINVLDTTSDHSQHHVIIADSNIGRKGDYY